MIKAERGNLFYANKGRKGRKGREPFRKFNSPEGVVAASAAIDATPLGLGEITEYVSQGSLADSATLGFGTIPRWGMGLRG